MPQNGILHQGITALSDALTTNTQLRILNMNDNTFTEAGAQAMAAVSVHTHARTHSRARTKVSTFSRDVDPCHTRVHTTRTHAHTRRPISGQVDQALKKSRSKFSENDTRRIGLQALPNLQKLEVLNFGDCLLRTKGAEAIADAIKDSHTSLKVRQTLTASNARQMDLYDLPVG